MINSFPVISTAILLFFILDPFGNVPLLLSVLKKVEKNRHKKIIFRECVTGLFILITFLFFGQNFLSIFHLETHSITLAGGIIFFVMAIKMIFPNPNSELFSFSNGDEPLIVPIAIPMLAGPAAIATLLVLAKTNPDQTSELCLSLFIAWAMCTFVLFFSTNLFKILKTKGVAALERLMGMLLLIMAVQMFVDGVRALLPTLHFV